MDKKSILCLILVFVTVFSTTGSAFADATIGIGFDKDIANVGDTIKLVITITNTGPEDLSDVTVSAPLPNGLRLMSFATGTSKNNYDFGSGIWQVDNLKLTSRGGGVKTLTITAVVLPELAGKTISANARYISVASGDPPVQLTVSGASSTLKVLENNPDQVNVNETGNNIDEGNESNVSNNNLTNNSSLNLNNLNNTQKSSLKKALSNITNSGSGHSNNNVLPNNVQSSPGKAYEIYNNPPKSQNSPLTVYIVGLLAIIGLVVIGYLYGVKK